MRNIEYKITLIGVAEDYQPKEDEKFSIINSMFYRVENSENLVEDSQEYQFLMSTIEKIMPFFTNHDIIGTKFTLTLNTQLK